MSNIIKILILSLVCLVIAVLTSIFIINITGGISVNQSNLIKELETLAPNEKTNLNVKLKFGASLNFIGKNVEIKTQDFEVKAGVLGVKKSLFSMFKENGKIKELFLEDGQILIYLSKEKTLTEALVEIYSKFPIGAISKKITFSNIDFLFSDVDITGSSFKIEKVNGFLENINGKITADGTFKIGGEIYKLESLFEEKGNTSFKVESENHSLKISLKDNVGKVLFSINNLTKFLNDITPDTINIDLDAMDSKKNAIYFESNILYNDVKKTLEFSNSSFQAFGNKTEEVQIESLSDNTYKINLDIAELNISESQKSNLLVVNDSKVPVLQFSDFIPNVKVLLDLKIGKINIKKIEASSERTVSNIKLNADFAYGRVNFALNLKINDDINVSSEGFLEHFEEMNRKVFVRSKILLENFDVSKLNIFNVASYKKEEKADVSIGFDTVLLGSGSIIFDEINLQIKDDIEIFSSKLEYDIYKKQADYMLEVNTRNLDISLLKLNYGKSFKTPNGDLFRILFDYLKFKQFSYIKFNCEACKLDGELSSISLIYFITPGKIELADFKITNENMEMEAAGILDIRNPSASVASFDLKIGKWTNFSLKKLFSINGILEDFDKLKLPSFENFSGHLKLEGDLISLIPLSEVKDKKTNVIKNAFISFSLNNGVLKTSASQAVINGFENKNFLVSEISLTGNVPQVSANLTLAGIEAAPIIQKMVGNKDYIGISGIFSVGASIGTSGFFIKDLIKNISSNLEIKSERARIEAFNLEAISSAMLDTGASFKKITNLELQDKITSSFGIFEVQSVVKITGREISLESGELKSLNSSSIFVGKYTFDENSKHSFQLLGKTAVFGADLNNGLKGAMPIYITQSLTSPVNQTEENKQVVEKKLDYLQVNKYAEARRVLFK
jgi:hypothetical protein